MMRFVQRGLCSLIWWYDMRVREGMWLFILAIKDVLWTLWYILHYSWRNRLLRCWIVSHITAFCKGFMSFLKKYCLISIWGTTLIRLTGFCIACERRESVCVCRLGLPFLTTAICVPICWLLCSPFFFSLSTMPGTKKLTVPQTSSSFQWNAPEVVSLCSQGSLYKMAKRLPFMWPGENVGYYFYFFLLRVHPETRCMAILSKRVSVTFLWHMTQNLKGHRKNAVNTRLYRVVHLECPYQTIRHLTTFLLFSMLAWPIPAYHIRQYACFASPVGKFTCHRYTGHFWYHKHSKPCEHFQFCVQCSYCKHFILNK